MDPTKILCIPLAKKAYDNLLVWSGELSREFLIHDEVSSVFSTKAFACYWAVQTSFEMGWLEDSNGDSDKLQLHERMDNEVCKPSTVASPIFECTQYYLPAIPWFGLLNSVTRNH
ncbi:hypothetical protein Golob_014411, partial [Gossypium lobatum]|nr:hypothetical protein [Gossypium lobatum]